MKRGLNHDLNSAELHTLTGAYAVHALADSEREAFRRHLGRCEACTQEVRELEAAAARLGTATAVTTAPEMKDRVLARIANVRQLPPEVAEPRSDRERDRERARRGARRRLGALPKFALAACIAAALVSGTLAVRWYEEAERAEQAAAAAGLREQRLSALLGAPDAVSASTPVNGGGNGMVVVSHARDEAAFFAGGLPALPDSRVYQLWFDDGGTMRSAGLLPKARDRNGAVLVVPDVRAASGVGLTVEPAGGSAQPTTDPLMLLPFPT